MHDSNFKCSTFNNLKKTYSELYIVVEVIINWLCQRNFRRPFQVMFCLNNK